LSREEKNIYYNSIFNKYIINKINLLKKKIEIIYEADDKILETLHKENNIFKKILIFLAFTSVCLLLYRLLID
jgi:hypothetical protein